MPRVLKVLLLTTGGLVLAGVGLGYLPWSGLQVDLARMNRAMEQARQHQERLLHQLESTNEELETEEARLREQQEQLSRKRAELAAQQEQLEARSRELAEKTTEGLEAWINSFCDPGHAETAGFLGAVQGLRGTSVRIDVPGLGPALELMRADVRQSQKERSP